MGDVSTATLTCRDCGTEIFRKAQTGGIPQFCAPCRAARVRGRQPEYVRRRKNPRKVHTCRDCGTEVFRTSPRGMAPQLCPPCKVEAKRRAMQKADHRRSGRIRTQVPATYTCSGCHKDFPRASRRSWPKHCPGCRVARERQRGQAKAEKKRAALRHKFETEGRWTDCETCGARFGCRRQAGPAPRRCEACRVARLNEKRKATRPWIRVGCCENCGRPTDRASRGGQPRRRCSKCNAGLRDPRTGRYTPTRREAPSGEAPYGPAWTRRRGQIPEDFTALDIFERDRWTCGICRKRIDPKLRAPHRMAATLDHLIPVIDGGIDSRANTRAAHQSCNSSRNHRGGGEQLLLVG